MTNETQDTMVRSDGTVDPSADLVFEVAPDVEVFDGVRKSVIDQLAREYTDVLAVEDVRGSIRIDVVELNAATWHVEATIDHDAGRNIDIETDVGSNEQAATKVMNYLRDRIEARYGDAIDTDAVGFASIDLRPAAWFVDARIHEQ